MSQHEKTLHVLEVAMERDKEKYNSRHPNDNSSSKRLRKETMEVRLKEFKMLHNTIVF
jgi:hypothetical protein